MMEIEVKKQKQTYMIQIHPKKMKRMILKYREGKFILSVPYGLSLVKIQTWLETLSQADFEKLKGHVKIKMNQDFVYLFGKKYMIKHYPLGLKQVKLNDDCIHIYHDKKEGPLERFLYTELESYLKQRLIDFYSMHYIDFIPEFKIQKMKSRFGACFYQKKLLKFSYILVHEKKEVIDSVIIHELGHFYYPNHSSDFYAWVKAHDPYFEEAKYILKNGGAGDDSVNIK